MSNTRIVTFKELKSEFGIPWCRQHIWRLEKAGLFPLRKRLGNRRVVWIVIEIVEWLNKALTPK